MNDGQPVVSANTPLVSIITIVYNNEKYICDAIESVLSQNYPNIEYLVIDGGSTDQTIELIKQYKDKIDYFVSEPDNGVYDALNKGIAKSNGEIIGILHSDDLFYDSFVISNSINKMTSADAEFCFSNMLIYDERTGKTLRYYDASYFSRWLFRLGWMPPHPTIFMNKSLFNEFGQYSTGYKVAGDFDFLVRMFYGRDIRWTYLNMTSVKMRSGGISNSGVFSKFTIMKEISRSLKSNKVWSVMIFQLGRYFIRLYELLKRPS